MSSPVEWEEVGETHEEGYVVERTGRLAVPGGWLVRVETFSKRSPSSRGVGLAFYPDPDHEWLRQPERQPKKQPIPRRSKTATGNPTW